MTLQKLVIFITLLFGNAAFGQKAEIDAFSKKLENSLIDNKNIILHTIRHPTEFDSLRYYDRYFIDTLKGILVKSIYEFDFEDTGEYLEFYYFNNEVIKVIAKHNFSERKYAGVFYFKSGSLIAHTDGEISPGEIVFDIQEILKTGNKYKDDSVEIIKSLKKKSLER